MTKTGICHILTSFINKFHIYLPMSIGQFLFSFKKLNSSHFQEQISVPPPEMINLSVRTICNLKCKMCHNWKPPFSKPNLFSTNGWKSIISDLRKEFPRKEIILAFTGSESLLYPDIFELIKHARNVNFDVWLHSNASLIGERTVNLLKECDLRNVSLSLDSLLSDEHNIMRGSDLSYDQVMRAINLLYDNGIRNININTVLCSHNIENIEKLITWVEKSPKVSNITLQAVTQPFNTKPELKWFDSKEFFHLWPKDIELVDNVLDSIIAHKEQYTKLVNKISQLRTYKRYFRNPLITINHSGCNVKSKQLNIGSAGNIWICPLEESGDLHQKTVHKIWTSEHHRQIYKNMSRCMKNCHLLINCAYEEEPPALKK